MDTGTDAWKKEKQAEVIPQMAAGPRGGGDLMRGSRVSADQHQDGTSQRGARGEGSPGEWV